MSTDDKTIKATVALTEWQWWHLLKGLDHQKGTLEAIMKNAMKNDDEKLRAAYEPMLLDLVKAINVVSEAYTAGKAKNG